MGTRTKCLIEYQGKEEKNEKVDLIFNVIISGRRISSMWWFG